MNTPPRDNGLGEETGPDDPDADILAGELAYEELTGLRPSPPSLVRGADVGEEAPAGA